MDVSGSMHAAGRRVEPRRAAVAAAIVALAGLGTAPLRTVAPSVAALIAPLATLISCACCIATAMRTGGTQRRTWASLAISSVMWSTAYLLWVATDTDISTPGLSVADVIYLLGILPMLVALIGLGGDAWETGARRRMLLDLLILLVAAILISQLAAWREIVESTSSAWDLGLFLAYPIVDVVLASVAAILLLRTSGPFRWDLALAAAAFTTLAISSTRYALWVVRGMPEGDTGMSIAFVIAPLLLALAALATPDERQQPSTVRRTTTGTVPAVVPDLVAFAAALTCVLYGLRSPAEWLLAAALMVLTVLRQIVLRTDNHQLRSELEFRVHERTSELRSLAERHRRVLDSVADGILGTDPTGMIQVVNPAASRILGWTPAELTGQGMCTHVCANDHTACPLHAALENPGADTASPATFTFARRDGSSLVVEATIAPMTQADGPAGIVLTFRDITDRELVERMKREFVSAVSHELRTPLTAIHGSLEMLVDGEAGSLPEPANELARVAVRGSERLGRLVNDIIDIERLETGRMRVDIGVHEIAPIVATTIRLMQPVADARDIQLSVGVVDGMVWCDPDRVNQVLVNLIDNALKFTPTGRRIEVRARRTESTVMIEVHDQGRGIPADQVDLVFRPFHQVDASDGDALGGTGLGLAITRAIVDQHGGDIWVESTLGVGSVFCFTLPAAHP